MRATNRNDIHDAARDRDVRLENFAAELTSAVYPLVLWLGPKDSWITVELTLWRALAETVEKWAWEPPARTSREFDAWREGFLDALTERAFSIALAKGSKGPFSNWRWACTGLSVS